MFEDDTYLVFSIDKLSNLKAHVKLRLVWIIDWCRFNKLSLNPSKRSYMSITHQNVENNPFVSLGRYNIQRVKDFKYLGINS